MKAPQRAKVGSRVVEFMRAEMPQTKPLSDLISIQRDFIDARMLCQRALDKADPLPEMVAEAVVSAAIVRYCRPFMESRGRRKLDIEKITSLSSDDRKAHDHIHEVRNGFLAHSSQEFHEAHVTIESSVVGGVRRLGKLNVLGHSYTVGDRDAKILYALIPKVAVWLDPQIEAMGTQVRKALHALPQNQIDALEPWVGRFTAK